MNIHASKYVLTLIIMSVALCKQLDERSGCLDVSYSRYLGRCGSSKVQWNLRPKIQIHKRMKYKELRLFVLSNFHYYLDGCVICNHSRV